MFIFNQKDEATSTAYKSQVKEIGILDPGEIDNMNLIDENGQIKPGLKIESDYKAVEPEIWNFLWSKYDGGPIIKRKTKDIYSEKLTTIDEE